MSRLARFLVPVTALALGAAFIAVPGGCSRKNAPAPATVRGKVTFQGEPLADGLIVFAPTPIAAATGKPAQGELDADGAFQLTPAGEATIPAGLVSRGHRPRAAIRPRSLRDRSRFPSICRAPIVRGSFAR